MSDVLTLCVVFVLCFITFLMVIGLVFVRSPRSPIERITRFISREKVEEPSGLERRYSFLMKIINRLSSIGSPKEERELSHTQLRLMKAGYRKKSAPRIFYGLKVSLAILFAAMFLVARVYLIQLPYTQTMFLLLLLTCTGLYLPDLWISLRARDRREQIIKGFPDALDLLVVCVEAGQGLDAAINRVGEEIGTSNKVLAEELKFLSLEIRAGKPRREALKSLAQRVDIEDISSFVVLINQTEQFGVSVARSLRVHSDSMRTKRHQKAEELAAKIPVKLVIPLIFFILPTLFVVMMGPGLIKAARVVIQRGILH